ncbi:MAG: NAD-dependent epimerase/dehydratase family protein [Sulfolobus sp.]|nr:NAD-dependent epimerase/dehydratase family protein [Sulfolobus sp.]
MASLPIPWEYHSASNNTAKPIRYDTAPFYHVYYPYLRDPPFKRVLITGVSGFVGSNIVEYSKEMGVETFGIARKEPSNKVPRPDHMIYLDLTSPTAKDTLIDIITKNSIDLIFHLAATSIVKLGVENPYGTAINNYLSALNVIHAAYVTNTRLVILGTDKEYGEGLNRDENSPINIRGGVYGVSKLSASLMALAYRDQFKTPITVARSVNIYGPWDYDKTRIIPKAIYNFMNGKPMEVYTPVGRRMYIYVSDLVMALFTIASHPEFDVVNICSNDFLDSMTVVKTIAKYFSKAEIKEIPSPYPEIHEQSMSCERLKSMGWRQEISFEIGIPMTVEWASNYLR